MLPLRLPHGSASAAALVLEPVSLAPSQSGAINIVVLPPWT